MTKKQKIWLSIFLAMFIVPEVLWSPVVKFYISWTKPTIHGSYQIWRKNFLDGYNTGNLWSNILLLQFFGLLFAAIYLIIIRKQFQNKIAYWAALTIMTVLTIFVFVVYQFSTIKISF